MKIDRRTFSLILLTTSAGRLIAQSGGMATRGFQAQTRLPPSGRPFSRFIDVAQFAGLTAKFPYGGVGQKTYIPEVMGAGCAFFDYDNDGWMDIFILGGTRLEGAPP